MDLENNNRKLYQHRQHIQLVQTQKQEDSTQKKEEHIKLNPKIQQSRHSQARQSYFDLEQSVSPTRQVVVKRNKRLTKNSDQLISTCENVIEEESKGVSIQQKPKKISLSRQAKKSIVEQNSVTQKGKYKGQKNVALSSKNQKEQFNFEIIRIINEVQHEALSKNNLLSNLNLAKQLIMIQSLKKAPSKRTPDDLKAIRSILRDNKFFAVLENEERDFESDIFQTCLSYVEYQHAPLCSVLFYQGEPGEKQNFKQLQIIIEAFIFFMKSVLIEKYFC